jgi:hypothetical protein
MESLVAIMLAHTAATLAMTGLIWFVQIVHYPLFDRVGLREFATYEKLHARLTSFVVMPLMLVEAGSAIALVNLMPHQLLVWVGLGLLALIWLSTFSMQVPQHRVLAKGFDPHAHRLLVNTNWVRTAAWSARSVIVLILLKQVIRSGSY